MRIGAKVMGPLEWLLLLTLSVIWGGSFFFGKIILAELRPLTLVLGRLVLAAIALNVIVLATGQRLPTSVAVWSQFAVMGFLNNLVPFSLIFWGETQITSGLASILNATTPLWTVLLAHWATQDERLTPNRLAGIVLGFAGVVVVLGPDALRGLRLNVLAELAIIVAAVSYALSGIYGKRLRGLPPVVNAAGQVTSAAFMMLPIALSVDRPWLGPAPGIRTWSALIALAVLCTAIAYTIYFRLLATAGATNVLLVTFLVPVSALFLGITILGEHPEVRHFAGMGLIGLGLAAIDGRVVAMLRARANL